jgi:Lrp/AsnC family transcriptional regulator for asnA, asnC and gidA
MGRYRLDDTDHKILTLLIKNARTPFLEIARECGISGAAVHQRVKKLEDANVIVGSRMLVRPRSLGLDICAFVNVKLSKPDISLLAIEELRKMPEVVECHFIAGPYSLLLKLYCYDNEHLMDVLVNQIPHIAGVSGTSSFISLEEVIEREPYLLPLPRKIEKENEEAQKAAVARKKRAKPKAKAEKAKKSRSKKHAKSKKADKLKKAPRTPASPAKPQKPAKA